MLNPGGDISDLPLFTLMCHEDCFRHNYYVGMGDGIVQQSEIGLRGGRQDQYTPGPVSFVLVLVG